MNKPPLTTIKIAISVGNYIYNEETECHHFVVALQEESAITQLQVKCIDKSLFAAMQSEFNKTVFKIKTTLEKE